METIDINLADKYSITLEKGLLADPFLLDFCAKQANTLVIIADDAVASLYGQSFLDTLKYKHDDTHLLTFKKGEENKTRKTKESLEDDLFRIGCGRDTCLIALGGGVTTDITGFIASTYCRGIPVIYMPTSLLAMVDASIGGKTGVDTPFGKNLIGTFYQPKAVFIDTNTLKTLPKDEFKNGLVEMIKHAVIADADYFSFLDNNAIYQLEDETLKNAITTSCIIKKNIVEQDEKDCGIRHLLNFGHTIGHALEQASHFQISHGYAVALGMMTEGYMSMQLGFLQEAALNKIEKLLRQCEIPLVLDTHCSKTAIKDALLLDKKAVAHQVRSVLLDDIGKPHHSDTGYSMPLSNEIIDKGLDYLFQFTAT